MLSLLEITFDWPDFLNCRDLDWTRDLVVVRRIVLRYFCGPVYLLLTCINVSIVLVFLIRKTTISDHYRLISVVQLTSFDCNPVRIVTPSKALSVDAHAIGISCNQDSDITRKFFTTTNSQANVSILYFCEKISNEHRYFSCSSSRVHWHLFCRSFCIFGSAWVTTIRNAAIKLMVIWQCTYKRTAVHTWVPFLTSSNSPGWCVVFCDVSLDHFTITSIGFWPYLYTRVRNEIQRSKFCNPTVL